MGVEIVFKLIVRVGGWLEKLKIRLNSASVEVEVEVEVEAELGNKCTLVLYPASPKPIFR